MTTPFVVEPSAAEFGPDFSATPPESELPPEPQQSTRAKNKASAKEPTGIFAGLGKNSPARSNVRRLTEDDLLKLAARYEWLAGLCKYFHPRLSLALEENAIACAKSWCDLAENNVKVRANILAVIEGGQIMGVAMAHAPLIIAAMPEKYVAMFMSGIMNMFQTATQGQQDDAPTDPYAQAFQPPPFTRTG